MTTKAHAISMAFVALMTIGIVALVGSPLHLVKAQDITTRANNGGGGGDGGIGGLAGHGGSGGNTPSNGDGYNLSHGGKGGPGGNAIGGPGGTGNAGADKTTISIIKEYP